MYVSLDQVARGGDTETFGYMSMDGFAVIPAVWPSGVAPIARGYPRGGPTSERQESPDVDGLQLV